MAINFSASFAACLAAGLKVPRQIMYCISQDTGAPYVLYKDSQEAAERGAALGNQWSPEMYPALQQTPQTHIPAHQGAQMPQNTTQSPPSQGEPPGQQVPQQTQSQQPPQQQQQQQPPTQQQQNDAHGPSPVTSPYPRQEHNVRVSAIIFKLNFGKFFPLYKLQS